MGLDLGLPTSYGTNCKDFIGILIWDMFHWSIYRYDPLCSMANADISWIDVSLIYASFADDKIPPSHIYSYLQAMHFAYESIERFERNH